MPPPDWNRYDLPQHVRLALWLVFAWYVGYIVNLHVQGYAAARAGGGPPYSDFTHTYAGSLLLRSQPAVNLYDDRRLRESMREATGVAYGPSLSHAQSRAINFSPWMYPPSYIFFIAPLAHFPYLLAFLGWCAATGAIYLAAMRSILPSSRAWPLFALAAPPVLNNLSYGQSGFLIAGLLGAGLSQIGRRPVLAGLLIGLASVKPHLGLLFPIALAAGGHWRVFGFATLTTIGLIVASAIASGVAAWFAWAGSLGYFVAGFEAGAFNPEAMASVLGAVRILGGDAKVMWQFQNAATVIVAVLVGWTWWRTRHRPDRAFVACAALCFATPLAVPSAYVYDLVLLAPGAAWLWRDYRDHGAHVLEYAALALLMSALIAIYPLVQTTGVPIGPVCVSGLLVLALIRFRRFAGKPLPLTDAG